MIVESPHTHETGRSPQHAMVKVEGAEYSHQTESRSFIRGVHHLVFCTDGMKKTIDFYTSSCASV